MKKVTLLLLIAAISLSLCGCQGEPKSYRDGDLSYLIDKDYVNKKLPPKMPPTAKLKYIYIHEYSAHYSIDFLLLCDEDLLFIDNNYWILKYQHLLRNQDILPDRVLPLEENMKKKFIQTVDTYELARWRKPAKLLNSGYWRVVLEFEGGIIYSYSGSGNKPKNFDDFLLQWYLLVDECYPGYFDDSGLNLRVYRDYQRQQKKSQS